MSQTSSPEVPSKVTVVEEGTSLKGTLTSSCPVDVRGRVEGELETPLLTVSATGSVHGRAKVGAVRSQGELSGEFDAESIELSGVVRDDTIIRARSLNVKLASTGSKLQVMFGSCELSVGDAPTESDREIEAAAAAAKAMPAALPDAPSAPVVPEPMAATPATADAPAADPAAATSTAAEGAAAPAATAGDADATEDEAWTDAADATGGTEGKRKRKRKNGQEEPKAGWSHPPSQPPPAS